MNTNRIPRVHRIPQGLDSQGGHEPGRRYYYEHEARPTPRWTLIGLLLLAASAAIVITTIVAIVRLVAARPDSEAVAELQHADALQHDARDREERRIEGIVRRYHEGIDAQVRGATK